MSKTYIHPEFGELRTQVRYRGGNQLWVIVCKTKNGAGGWAGLEEEQFPPKATKEEQQAVLDKLADQGLIERIQEIDAPAGVHPRLVHPRLGEIRVRPTSTGKWFAAFRYEGRGWVKWEAVQTVDTEEECRRLIQEEIAKESTSPGGEVDVQGADPFEPAEAECSARNTFEGVGEALQEAEEKLRLPGSRELNLSMIDPSPMNPRKRFGEEALSELAGSLKRHGMIEPIIVRGIVKEIKPGLTENRYEVIAGERRFRAARMAGLTKVPCLLRQMDDREAAEIMLVENLQRQDLDPLEEAEGYEQLRKLGYTEAEIADKVNRGRPTVANALRLLKLPGEVKEHVSEGRISPSAARAMVSNVDHPKLFEAQVDYALSGASSKDVEQFIPINAWDLETEGIIRRMEAHSCPFDFKSECRSCKSFRSHGEVGYCLDPDCCKRKSDEARAARIAEAQESESAAVLQLTDLNVGMYELSPEQYPACREVVECEHRRPAIAQNGEMVTVCLDPKCFKRCRQAAHAAEASQREGQDRPAPVQPVVEPEGRLEFGPERREAEESRDTRDLAGLLGRALSHQADTEWFDRYAAVAMYSILRHTEAPVLHHALQKLGMDLSLVDLIHGPGPMTRRLDALAGMKSFRLTLLAAECALTSEVSRALAAPEARWSTEFLDWILGAEEKVGTCYQDPGQDAVLLVHETLTKGQWAVMRAEPGKTALHRVKSPELPVVYSREDAQRNLDSWASKRRLEGRPYPDWLGE